MAKAKKEKFESMVDIPIETYGMTPLGYKILLDRYAIKEQDREAFLRMNPGTILIVKTDDTSGTGGAGQKELGFFAGLTTDDHVQIYVPSLEQTIVRMPEYVDIPIETTPGQVQARVAAGIAKIEQDEAKINEATREFKWLLEDWKFVPGGRILSAAGGQQELTFYNCYVIPPPKDSKVGIFDTLNDMAQIMSRGGGVGINISTLRPRYSHTKATNGRSSGAVSWGEVYSFVTGLIEQGGSNSSNTLVATAAGVKQLGDLVGTRPWVYTYSHEYNEIILRQAKWVRCTGRGKELYKVITNRGLEFEATSDHLVMLRDGSYVPVSNLQEGDMLMPMHRRKRSRGVCMRTDPFENQSELVLHKHAWREYHGELPVEEMHIHHINKDHWDNSPENLELVTNSEHQDAHCAEFSSRMSVMEGNPSHSVEQTRRAVLTRMSKLMLEEDLWLDTPESWDDFASEQIKSKTSVIMYSDRLLNHVDSWDEFLEYAKQVKEKIESDGFDHHRDEEHKVTKAKILAMNSASKLLDVGYDISTPGLWDSVLADNVFSPRAKVKRKGLCLSNITPRSENIARLFRSYSEFYKEAQEFDSFIVERVSFSRVDDVYDMEVPGTYNFCIMESEEPNSSGVFIHNSRRGALMLIMNDWHPDILEFISAKKDMNRITNANVSVGVSDAFMQAVEQDLNWDLEFPDTTYSDYDEVWNGDLEVWKAAGFPTKLHKRVKARFIWDRIVEAAWASAEPGLWFRDVANRESNSYYFAPLVCTNPCVTGDSLIAVADGRHAVPIKQLAEEEEDVPVYAYAPGEGITISVGRNPRLTRKQAEVWKVTLDDGSSLRVTPDHKFMLRDGSYTELRELQIGDSLMPFNKHRTEIARLANERQPQLGGYWKVRDNSGGEFPEHRKIMEFILGRDLLPYPDELVHHKNRNPSANSWDNLELMQKGEHSSWHMEGNKNPMRGKWWIHASEEEKEAYRQNMSSSTSGENNGMFGYEWSKEQRQQQSQTRKAAWEELTPEEREKFGQKVSEGMYEKRPDRPWDYEKTPEIRAKIAATLTLPRVQTTCLYCNKAMIVTSRKFENDPVGSRLCSERCMRTYETGVSSEERHRAAVTAYSRSDEGRRVKGKAGSQKWYNMALRQAKWMLEKGYVIDFLTWDSYRDEYRVDTGSFHSIRSQKVQELFDVNELVKVVSGFNHKVIAVEFDGYEDVYNITVDDYHNVCYVTGIKYGNDDKFDVLTGVNTSNCGEQPLPAWGVCNLGALNLSKFVFAHSPYFFDDSAVLGERSDNPKRRVIIKKYPLVNWRGLQRAVRAAVHFLDNVIDTTPYFYEQNREQQLGERRVGMGTLGLAEMLVRLEIRYGSEECLEFIDHLYSFIAEEAYLRSTELSVAKGAFPQFNEAKYLQSGYMQRMPKYVQDAIRQHGIRNVTLLTQAPTGTTGTMVNTSTGIEPFFYWQFERKGRLGNHIEQVHVLQEYLDKHTELQNVSPDDLIQHLPSWFVTAMDLTPVEHVHVLAAIQRHVDSAISKTSNLPEDYTVEQTAELYRLMYDLGVKGGTVYRDNSRDMQVLNLLDDGKSKGERPAWRSRPDHLRGETIRKKSPVGTVYVTVNSRDDGPFEVFAAVGKAGSEVTASAEAMGRLISYILRMPSQISPTKRVSDVVAQLAGIGTGRPFGFGPNKVMSLPDAIAQIIAECTGIQEETLEGLPEGEYDVVPNNSNGFMPTGDVCPTCGHSAFFRMEGCSKCIECGYSEC